MNYLLHPWSQRKNKLGPSFDNLMARRGLSILCLRAQGSTQLAILSLAFHSSTYYFLPTYLSNR